LSAPGKCSCCREENGVLYLDGYIEQRVRAGDKREYPEPGMGGLPEIHGGPRQMESSLIVALREAKQP